MRDLRTRVLRDSSMKTISRKARSRPDSGIASPVETPDHSRANSRYASEEELSESEYNESTVSSAVNSEYGDEEVAPSVTWPDKLHSRIESLIDRKRTNAAARESALSNYCHLIRHHYAEEYIDPRLGDIIPSLLKSIRAGSSVEESVLALKALQSTIISAQSESLYHRVFSTIKTVCQDSEEEDVKVDALVAMAVATMCGGGTITDAEDYLEFLTEIIESDGHSILAGDNGPVVTAALMAWGFVASHLEDLQVSAEAAFDAFIEQLDSIDVDVQIAAGTNIALVCESAREFEEETGEIWSLDYNKHQLINRMRALTKESSKAISKKDRRQLHTSFNSVLTSLERGKGPGYSTALDENLKEFGYREKLRIQNISLSIDSWALSVRIEALKWILGGGFAAHYMENPAVKDLLSDAHAELVSGGSKLKKKGSADNLLSPKKARGNKANRNTMGL